MTNKIKKSNILKIAIISLAIVVIAIIIQGLIEWKPKDDEQKLPQYYDGNDSMN